MVFQRLFKPRPALQAGRDLYASAAHQARSPGFYASLGAPDTGEGRFELYSLHVALLVLRLKGQGAEAAETSQGVFDAYLQSLDDGLREMGVGDLVVGKRMRKLGEAFYGRVRSLEDALADESPQDAVQALLGRTALPQAGDAETSALAGYVFQVRDGLAGQPLEGLLRGEVAWPEGPR